VVGLSSTVTWIPVSQACRILRVSRQRVYQLINAGELVGRKLENTWLVSQFSVNDRKERLSAERMS
jgi:hypothetical protein